MCAGLNYTVRMNVAARRRLLELTFLLRGIESRLDLYSLPLDSPDFERWCALRAELFDLRERHEISDHDYQTLTT